MFVLFIVYLYLKFLDSVDEIYTLAHKKEEQMYALRRLSDQIVLEAFVSTFSLLSLQWSAVILSTVQELNGMNVFETAGLLDLCESYVPLFMHYRVHW